VTLWPRLLEVLKDGPGTAAEIALELELDSRRIAVNLREMWLAGYLTREKHHPVSQLYARRGSKTLSSRRRRVLWRYGLDADLVRAPMVEARR